jgi:hypothetical protein
MRAIGIVLVVIGVFALVYTGYTYYTEENVMHIGSVEITKEKPHYFSWPPVVGFVLIVAGAVAILTDKKNKTFS